MIKIIRQNYQKNINLFNKTKIQLVKLLGDLVDFEHIGSTAIPDMSGKNIIDILIDTPNNIVFKKMAEKIKNSNYYIGENNFSDYLFFSSRKEETKNGDVHLHLVIKGSNRYKDFLFLKKYLIDNPGEAKNYSKIKYKIAKEINNDRKKYKLLKSEYVNELLKCARSKYDGKTTK